MKAIVLGDAGSGETARIDLAKCIGCGLCVSSCPDEAISLVQRSPLPDVPQDVIVWMEKAVETRGVKEEFLKELQIRKRGL